jgi:CRP-like cAMP-binding protein
MRESALHVVGTNRLLDLLPQADKERVLPTMERITGKQGDVLFKRKKTITHVYFPLGGVISMVLALTSGERVECAMVGNEGMSGVSLVHGVTASRFDILFQVPGEAMRMSTAAFCEEMARNGAFASLNRRYAEACLGLIAQSTACNNFHAVEQRLSRVILMSQDRVGSDKIPLTQRFLAEMLGVRRTSVSPAAGALQREGLIRYTRGVIIVLKRAELKARSCECYQSVRKDFECLLR